MIDIANYTHGTYKGYEYVVYYFEMELMGIFDGYVKIPDNHPAIEKLRHRTWYDTGLSLWRVQRSEAKREKKRFTTPKPKSKRYYSWTYEAVGLRVYGGPTFGEKITQNNIGDYLQPFTVGWWVGWDYNHAGDAMFLPKERIIDKEKHIQSLYHKIMNGHNQYPTPFIDKRWTWEEVENDCLDAIEQLIKLEKGYPKCAVCSKDFNPDGDQKLCWSCEMNNLKNRKR